MGQNPVNSRPDLPQQPPSGPTGPSASDSGPQSGPGYGYQGPQVAAPGPQDPAASPAYPTPSPTPYGTMPYGTMPYGTMPYGPPPGAGQPGPGPGQPYAGAASQQYAIPGAASTGPTPKKKGKGPLVGLVAGAVVLVLVVGAVATYLLTNRATPAGTEPDTATTSVSALQGYLNALAAGDADKAKLYGVDAPASSPFLTNDFLKAAVTKNPITEIHVTEATDAGTSQYLSASYKLGGDPMQGSYQLTKVAKTWRLKTIITTVDRPSNWGTLGVTVNGTPASASQLSFFPGMYELGTGTSLTSFLQPMFTVGMPGGSIAGFATAESTLTDAGKKLMITKSQDWLTQCLPLQDLNPKDCGMSTPLPDGGTVAPGSIKRTVDASNTPFAASIPLLSMDDPTKVTLSSAVVVTVTAADTAGNTYSGTTTVTRAVGTITGENLTVVFTE